MLFMGPETGHTHWTNGYQTLPDPSLTCPSDCASQPAAQRVPFLTQLHKQFISFIFLL